MKKILSFIITYFLISISVFANIEEVLPSQKGVVKAIEYVDLEDSNDIKQIVEIKLLNGNSKGEVIYVDNMLSGNSYYDIKLKKGTNVILHVEKLNDSIIYSIENIQRSHALLILSVLFCGLLIYVGRKKGVYSLLSIAITCVLITNFLSPMILAGIDPIISTIIICVLSTAITMYLVGGFNRKSSSATIGCILSLVFAGILALFTTKIASLTGFNSEESMFLYTAHPELNFVAIAISTIILATMGAVMDVAMSIASTINEIYTIDNSKTIKELFTSGMNVGRDIIGTMANTLILVYLGASLPLLLLASNIDLQKFFNLNQVATEISSALIGSIAIVICVPITAFIASSLIKNTAKKIEFPTIQE